MCHNTTRRWSMRRHRLTSTIRTRPWSLLASGWRWAPLLPTIAIGIMAGFMWGIMVLWRGEAAVTTGMWISTSTTITIEMSMLTIPGPHPIPAHGPPTLGLPRLSPSGSPTRIGCAAAAPAAHPPAPWRPEAGVREPPGRRPNRRRAHGQHPPLGPSQPAPPQGQQQPGPPQEQRPRGLPPEQSAQGLPRERPHRQALAACGLPRELGVRHR